MATEPISILHFSNSDVRGGAEEHILTLLRHLDRKYFRLYLVCTPECAEQLRVDLPSDVQLIPLTLSNPFNWRPALQFGRLLQDRKISILHSHLFRASLAASPVGWQRRVPVVIETPHVREAWRRGFFKGRYFVDRGVGHFVDHYIAVSEANAQYLINEKRLPENKIRVIHNGCDLAKFAPNRPMPKGLKQSLGFSDDNPILLALGRLETQKGHRFLLNAHARVTQEFPEARLVCVGEGSLRQELEEQTRRLQIQDSVRFVGFQSNIADWLAIADISVLPSLFEGLPLVAIESLAAERAMIATRVDGTTEVVRDGETGLTVTPAEPQELAEAMLRLLRDPGLRVRLARAGRQWVVNHFDQEQQIRKTQELYWHSLHANQRRAMAKPGIDIPGEGEGERSAAVKQTSGAVEQG
jgi:glycosyltransferase involved in cell wall biosynthesis